MAMIKIRKRSGEGWGGRKPIYFTPAACSGLCYRTQRSTCCAVDVWSFTCVISTGQHPLMRTAELRRIIGGLFLQLQSRESYDTHLSENPELRFLSQRKRMLRIRNHEELERFITTIREWWAVMRVPRSVRLQGLGKLWFANLDLLELHFPDSNDPTKLHELLEVLQRTKLTEINLHSRIAPSLPFIQVVRVKCEVPLATFKEDHFVPWRQEEWFTFLSSLRGIRKFSFVSSLMLDPFLRPCSYSDGWDEEWVKDFDRIEEETVKLWGEHLRGGMQIDLFYGWDEDYNDDRWPYDKEKDNHNVWEQDIEGEWCKVYTVTYEDGLHQDIENPLYGVENPGGS
ncbi:hypothetical protein BDN72DRAFT_941480 [Pluteus cervinus]|uniref:Uncharacterized protein n=1 Tax=Pluteus cervinus TaxID=181527 RepID=A0ACD3A2W7_9AGAR|nr:hypothetical protein BDN72DRAFT_941480 [Pluteus cervinus]